MRDALVGLADLSRPPGPLLAAAGAATSRGLNSKIRLISRRSFGFHSAAALIALVYLCWAGVVSDLPR
jgi:hypothetical protein